MIRERYAIWNNKGGVGKSTLTFHLASQYAAANPTQNILVIDMCPQANSTMMFLGSGTKGEDLLISMENRSPAPTIAGYIAARINRQTGVANEVHPAASWMVRPYDSNAQIPSNLYLVAGDGNLELLAAPIAYYSNAQFPAGAWGAVHRWIRELADELTGSRGEWTVFVDTNPSFAIYTELAMVAADKLIVPFNADDSSRHAVSAITRLLYGAGAANPVYDRFTFRHRTKENGLNPPKLHLFVGNRFTQYKGSAAAFSALHEAVGDSLWEVYQKSKDIFTDTDQECENRDGFLAKYSVEVRDFNSAGVVAAHYGTMLSSLEDRDYLVHGRTVTVRTNRVEACIDSINEIVQKI